MPDSGVEPDIQWSCFVDSCPKGPSVGPIRLLIDMAVSMKVYYHIYHFS